MSVDAKVHEDQTHSKVAPSALALLESARHGLAAGKRDTSAASRYVAAHLAALRTAAAVVAARPDPGTGGRRKQPQSVWELLPRVEPAFSGWAAYFAAAGKRRTTGTRRRRQASPREADRLVRSAEAFVSLAEDTLGVTAQRH